MTPEFPEFMVSCCLATAVRRVAAAGYLRTKPIPHNELEGAEIKPDLATLPLVSR
jgi:hypothetical protein